MRQIGFNDKEDEFFPCACLPSIQGKPFPFLPSYTGISSSTLLHLQLKIEMRNYSLLPEVRKDMMSSDGSHEGTAISSIYGEFISCPAQST